MKTMKERLAITRREVEDRHGCFVPNSPVRCAAILGAEAGEVLSAATKMTRTYNSTCEQLYWLNNLRKEIEQVYVFAQMWLEKFEQEDREDDKREAEADYNRARRAMGVGGQGDGGSSIDQIQTGTVGGADRSRECGSHSVLEPSPNQDATVTNSVGAAPDETNFGRRNIHPAGDTSGRDRVGITADRGGCADSTFYRPSRFDSPTGTSGTGEVRKSPPCDRGNG